MATPPEIIADCKEKMAKAVEHLRDEFSRVRTGRATPALAREDAHRLLRLRGPAATAGRVQRARAAAAAIQPYDKGAMGAIEKAIQQSDLGINPSNDGQVVRLVFPSSPRSGARRW